VSSSLAPHRPGDGACSGRRHIKNSSRRLGTPSSRVSFKPPLVRGARAGGDRRSAKCAATAGGLVVPEATRFIAEQGERGWGGGGGGAGLKVFEVGEPWYQLRRRGWSRFGQGASIEAGMCARWHGRLRHPHERFKPGPAQALLVEVGRLCFCGSLLIELLENRRASFV